MECADLVAFTFASWQIRSGLLCAFIWPEATVMTLFAVLRVSLVSWGKWSELFGCFIASSSEIVKKIKYLQAKQRICRECKDYVIGREITRELKITVDNAILELCDFFASPLIKWCAVVSTVINESSRTALECALRLSKTLFFTTNSSRNICIKFVFLPKVNYMIFYAKPTLCKECNQKRWPRSDILLSRWLPHIGRNKNYSFPIQPCLKARF